MVAAWISAETGVEALHGVGQPDIQRKLRGLTGCADQEQQRDCGERGFRLARGGRENFVEIERAEVDHDQKHRQRKSEIADAVDDEGFDSGVGGALLEEVEADQKIAAQTHAFPSHKEHQVVRGQNQNQHEKHEQVEVGEEPVVAAFMRHVAGGVNVNQRSDAGHDKEHDGCETVYGEVGSDAKVAALEPGEITLDVGGLHRPERQEGFQHPGEREQDGADCDHIDERVRAAASEDTVRQEPQERE